MVLAAVARDEGWDVRCIDTYLEQNPVNRLREVLRDFQPEVVGFSALTAESVSMYQLATIAREAAPDALILAGGAHPSAEPDETARNPAIDVAVVGEGEDTLREILRRRASGSPWRDVRGIVFCDSEGVLHRTLPRPHIEDLDSLPFPAWDLTDIDAYATRRGMSLVGERRYMPLTTSRGCPYRCTYCHGINGKRFRSHSPEYVLRMIDELRSRYDVHGFDITDDIFNFDAERMMAICDGLIERGPGIGFTCPNGIRADRMTVEQVDRMARAGCEYVAIAIETVSRRLQKQIKKNLRLDRVQPIIDAFTARNVLTSGFFMLGFPTETEQELRATIDFAIDSNLHAAIFFVVTPFADTEMYNDVAEAFGEAATELTGTGLYLRPRRNYSQLTNGRFLRLRREAYLRFYLHPNRIRRIWRTHPRREHLMQYAATMFVRDVLRIDPGRILGPVARFRTSLEQLVPVFGRRSQPRARRRA